MIRIDFGGTPSVIQITSKHRGAVSRLARIASLAQPDLEGGGRPADITSEQYIENVFSSALESYVREDRTDEAKKARRVYQALSTSDQQVIIDALDGNVPFTD